MKKISILGSTGSIGCSTLEVVANNISDYSILGLAAGKNSGLLKKQILQFKPEIVSLSNKKDADELKNELSLNRIKVLYEEDGVEEIARHPDNDIVVSAITGIKGLRPTLAALEEGKTVALANKESMVTGGGLIKKCMLQNNSRLIPIDSEHSGVFQCLHGEKLSFVHKIVLTASGGPFINTPIDQMHNISLEQALAHPNWRMGAKVTIDSATLMNKGLELIEAKWLFDLKPEQLDMIIHPQSFIHCLVEMRDGSLLAQLSKPDMKIPIQYALSYPDRKNNSLQPFDLAAISPLEFQKVDFKKFPLAGLALSVLEEEESFSVAMNAANEEAVEAFLQSHITFSSISRIVSEVVDCHSKVTISNLEDIFEIDRENRMKARKLIKKGN